MCMFIFTIFDFCWIQEVFLFFFPLLLDYFDAPVRILLKAAFLLWSSEKSFVPLKFS